MALNSKLFKLALGAGHRLGTPGKCCLKSLDPNETREWVLNARICEKLQSVLAGYDGIEILRVDDPAGIGEISVAERNAAANEWGADFALAIHHNAGINGGKGGGIMVYRYPNDKDIDTIEWQKLLYDSLIGQTGLKGNRASPLATANFEMLRGTKMPSILLELGFMDSSTDVPIILTDRYAEQCAQAIAEVIVVRAGLHLRKPEHWAQKHYDSLIGKGILAGDSTSEIWLDFDAPLTEVKIGVLLALIDKATN